MDKRKNIPRRFREILSLIVLTGGVISHLQMLRGVDLKVKTWRRKMEERWVCSTV